MKGLHFLLTYTCNLQCDHCFLFCGPRAEGTMTLGQVHQLLEEAAKIGTIEEVYFEGGEPFLFYPVMVEGIRRARSMGFNAGVVTNAYWATSPADARLWLKPLAELGVHDFSVSADDFHLGTGPESPAQIALEAARDLGIPTLAICKSEPEVRKGPEESEGRGAPEVSGGIKLRGRAVDSFAAGLPTRPRGELDHCPFEALENPSRVHVDAHGHVQLCQGISMGNCWETPLSQLVQEYDPYGHPICGPLLRGGPDALMREHGIKGRDAYVDECHMCYAARAELLQRWPGVLAPKQVYGG